MAVKERFAIWQIILEELSHNRADRPFDYHGWLCGPASSRSCSTALGEVQEFRRWGWCGVF